MKQHSIALSMIVKNEEKFLEGCLSSVQGLVDKIIIVDTGSTDQTISIAKKYNAEVYNFEWADDFAAARNFALRHTNAEWVLYLDADERLNPEYHPMVYDLINSGQADAIAVKIRSQVNGPLGNVPHLQTYPRIFKKMTGVQFEFPIHEQIMPSLLRVKARIIPSKIVIEHLGYAQDETVILEKINRNIDFLEKQVQSDPHNAYALYQLGQTYGLCEDKKQQSAQYLKLAIDKAGSDNSIKGMAYLHLALLEFEEKRYQEALVNVEHSLKVAPVQYSGLFFRAELNFILEAYPMALKDYQTVYRVLKQPPANRKSMLMVEKELSKQLVLRRILESFVYLEQYQMALQFLQEELSSITDMDEHWMPLLTILLENDQTAALDWSQISELVIQSNSPSLGKSALIYFIKSRKWKELPVVHKYLRKKIKNLKALPPDILIILAESEYEAGNFSQADQAVQAILDKDPNNRVAGELKGNIGIKTGDLDRAINEYQKLVEMDSTNIKYLKILGGLYAKQEKFDQLQRIMHRIQELG